MQIANPRRAAVAVERTLGLSADRICPSSGGPLARLRLRRPPGGPRAGRRAEAPEASRLRLLSRGAPHATPGVGGCAGARVRRARTAPGCRASSCSLKSRSRAATARRRSSRIRAAASSMCRASGRRFRAATCTSRWTTASRRTPRRFCARRFGSGQRRARAPIVLDPRTGAILAMAVQPGYDANRFSSAPIDLQRNRTVTRHV